MIAPLAWTFSTSLKTKDGVFELPPQWIPDPFVWENYARIWTAGPLLSGIQNSLIVACSVTIIGSLTSALAAFAFAKMRMPFKNVLFLGLLSGLMIPFPTLMIPQFTIFAEHRLGGHPAAADRAGTVRQHHHDLLPAPVPEQRPGLHRGSRQDRRRLLPADLLDADLARPSGRPSPPSSSSGSWPCGTTTSRPIIYLNSPGTQTLQLVIANFNAQYAIQTDYPLIMAASFIALLPVLIVFIVFQRQIIESIALSGSKG